MGDAPLGARAARSCFTLALLALHHRCATAQQFPYRAIASMRGATGLDSVVSGTVTFEQLTPLGDVTVTVNIVGLRPGQHGFHVHQFGDVRETSDLSTMSAHFVPYCAPPDLDENGNTVGGCQDDQKHGLPPSVQRQPGDMGNLLVGFDGSVTTRVFTIGQSKMSLSDPLRSIVGRTVLVHSERDDGSQPYGNAGPPEAYGVIGLASTPTGVNLAKAPEVPHVTKVICTFEHPSGLPVNPTIDGMPASISGVTGSALLELMEPDRPGIVRMRARLYGLPHGSTHSFHFHQWGDMSVGLNSGALGAIYSEHAIEVASLHVNAQGFGLFDDEFASGSLLSHVGRSLTIHQGPGVASPTIAAAVCGLAHPRASLDSAWPSWEVAHASVMPSLSPGVIALLVICCPLALLFLIVSCLYYHRMPIPFCGKYLYMREAHMASIPPPPPRADLAGPAAVQLALESGLPGAPYGVSVEKL